MTVMVDGLSLESVLDCDPLQIQTMSALQRMANRLYRSGAGARHIAAWLRSGEEEHPQWSKCLAHIQSLAGSGMCLALRGERGTGKTQLATELMAISWREKKSAYYISLSRLLMRFRETFDHESVVQDLTRYHLLVMDEIDLAVDRGKEVERSQFATVVDERYRNNRDTLLITNLSEKEIKRALPSSVLSRIMEGGGVIGTTWPPIRKAT